MSDDEEIEPGSIDGYEVPPPLVFPAGDFRTEPPFAPTAPEEIDDEDN